MTRLLAITFALFLALPVRAELDDNGLYVHDWIEETFLDLGEDLESARAQDKRMAIFIEQRGCLYCKKMHEEVYSDPEVEAYIEESFYIIRVNLHGSTEVTDLDGEVLTEKGATRKWGVLFTPTVLFMPEESDGGLSAAQAAVAMMPGAFSKSTALDLFTWVNEKRYLDISEEDFQRYHARKLIERREEFGN